MSFDGIYFILGCIGRAINLAEKSMPLSELDALFGGGATPNLFEQAVLL